MTPPSGRAVPPVPAVGLVGPLPPPSGGMANQTRQLARLLAEAGMTVELVQNNAAYRPAWIGRLPGIRALFRLLPYLGALWRCAGRVDLLHVMANSGWAWHLFAAPAIWIGWIRGRPVIVNYRGGDAEGFLARQARWVHPTLARAAALIVPSGFLDAVFARHGIGALIVPNVIDLSRFSPAPQVADGPHLIITRNLEPIYDIATALHAFVLIRAAWPQARLSVAGSGPERERLESLARRLEIADAVRFTGRLDTAELPPLYRSATLMLNPSTVDNMPNSLLEAMASGVPVVSTRVGGIPYMAEDGREALLVAPRDPEAMAHAALRVLGDRSLAAALRDGGLAAVRRYTWDEVRPCLFATYARAAGGGALSVSTTT